MNTRDPAGDAHDPVLTTSGAARVLGVAVSTAQQWIESGALDSWRTPGGHRRVRLSAVMQLLEKGRGGASAGGLEPEGEFLPVDEPGYPVAGNEAQRLRAVANARLVDTPAEQVFDRLTWLATQVTGCGMALLSVLSARRQWFKSRTGLTITETPRDIAFCSHAILSASPFVVEDATRDARFRDNPLVTAAPHIRLYAGVAVRDRKGFALGTLCVLDDRPRRLEAGQLRALQELAAIASEEIQRRGSGG